MKLITIPISAENHARLCERAEQFGLSEEEFLSQSIESFLNQQDKEFQDVAKRVLEKNAELYRRLA